jgi:hypothetical protein
VIPLNRIARRRLEGTALQAALIWLAHIAHDRIVGWGLETEKSFFHTDLGTRRLPFRAPALDRHLQ